MERLKYWNAFNLIPGFGPVKFKRINYAFSSLESAWRANLPDLMSARLTEDEANNIIINRSNIDPDSELEKLCEQGISLLAISDSDYPRNLKEIHNPPFLLYIRGDHKILNTRCLAVVGSRKHTSYGQKAVESIVADLAKEGLTIVSGLALGIDALAHEYTLNNNGLTVAVLGSDLSWQNIGPKANFQLAERILENGGCILSEYPLGIQASKTTFPQRNRLISGLSMGTIVIEAGENSGSLITASYALEQNRDVFAIPGNIFSEFSAGTNNLIKKGAKLVLTAQDVLDEFSWQQTLKLDNNADKIILTEEEEKIISALCDEPLHLDKIAEVTNTKINALSSILMMLELKGVIKNNGGGSYIKL